MKSLGPQPKKKINKIKEKEKRKKKKRKKEKKRGLAKLLRAKKCFEVVEKSLVDFKKEELKFLRSFGERCELGLTFGNDCVIVCLGKG